MCSQWKYNWDAEAVKGRAELAGFSKLEKHCFNIGTIACIHTLNARTEFSEIELSVN